MAWTYQAEILCGRCLRKSARYALNAMGLSVTGLLEALLIRWAEEKDINRADESSYDSDDFPKPVTRQQLDHDVGWGGSMRCDGCSRNLGG